MATIERPINHYTVTMEELALAIKNSIEEDEMPDEQAAEMANRILNFFGHGERVVDNILEPVDRDPFYMLEDAGILTTEIEEITLYDGREWRIHYWLFRMDRIRDLMGSRAGSAEGSADDGSVYDSLADDIWHHQKR